MICLFPLWPYKVKVIVFYLSLYALIAIMIFSIIRFLIYYFFRLFGFEFWILPEIFENDSFKPYYSFNKVEESQFSMIVRVAFLIATIVYMVFLYMFPTIYDGVGDILLESYDDVIDWGKNKILFDFTKDISSKSISYEKLLESEEDEI